MKYHILIILLLSGAVPTASAASNEALSSYQNQGAGPFNGETGRQLWVRVNNPKSGTAGRSCADCHGENLSLPGKHLRTGKVIKPMNPAVTPERLTDNKKIEKWFKRNCKWTFGRECTPQEKGDLILFIRNQNG